MCVDMGVTDIITRVDVICKKYDKYDLDKQKQVNIASGASDDVFLRLYAAVDSDLHQLLQVLQISYIFKNRTNLFIFTQRVFV